MRGWIAGVGLVVLVLGCGGDAVVEGPPEIQYGLEECDTCRMILSEERYAAAATSAAGGEAARFDDAGCLVAYLAERPGEAWTAWVHDHGGGGWVRASSAWFVRDPSRATPMASGILAFAEREGAAAFAREVGGAVLTWSEIRSEASGP